LCTLCSRVVFTGSRAGWASYDVLGRRWWSYISSRATVGGAPPGGVSSYAARVAVVEQRFGRRERGWGTARVVARCVRQVRPPENLRCSPLRRGVGVRRCVRQVPRLGSLRCSPPLPVGRWWSHTSSRANVGGPPPAGVSSYAGRVAVVEPHFEPRECGWATAPRGRGRSGDGRAEAAQPEAVGHHEHAGERHRGTGEHRVEETGGREGEGGDVVGECPEEVALDRGEGAA
jgi:hypothetical protein